MNEKIIRDFLVWVFSGSSPVWIQVIGGLVAIFLVATYVIFTFSILFEGNVIIGLLLFPSLPVLILIREYQKRDK